MNFYSYLYGMEVCIGSIFQGVMICLFEINRRNSYHCKGRRTMSTVSQFVSLKSYPVHTRATDAGVV